MVAPIELEFQQAVHEIETSLAPLFAISPEYKTAFEGKLTIFFFFSFFFLFQDDLNGLLTDLLNSPQNPRKNYYI